MLAKITIVCFAASYGVALLLEVSRLFFRLPVRLVVMLGFGAAGLVAHTLFFLNHAYPSAAQPPEAVPFASFYMWFLLAAWLLAAAYVALAATRPQSSIGIFMLPVVLALILVAQFSSQAPFPRGEAVDVWHKVHGYALLLGTVAASFGFVAGLMYLVQSYRLKHKLLPRPGLRLPSLEWLQMTNKQTLYVAAILMAVGVFAGVVLNVVYGAIPWSDPSILSSAGLLAWLFAATLFELLYKPAQQGRKVAYLTIANFIVLAAVLLIVLFSKHAADNPSTLLLDSRMEGRA
jgi:ABC-type transport system involved in cytochrome c biogenesis permease subunit